MDFQNSRFRRASCQGGPGDGGATPDDIANKHCRHAYVDNRRSLCHNCRLKDMFDAPYDEQQPPAPCTSEIPGAVSEKGRPSVRGPARPGEHPASGPRPRNAA